MRILYSLLAMVGLVGILVPVSESCHRQQGTVAERKASEAKGRADEHAKAGGVADAQAAEAARRVEAAEASVDRLKRELEVLRRPQPAPPATPDAPADTVDLAPMVAKQDELIQAQDAEISALKIQVIDLTTARDHWRAAARAQEDRALSLEIALEAQKSMTRGALWRGRLQGVAIGFAAGYVTERAR